MKYAAVILSIAVGAFALPQEGSTITSAPASAASVALTPQVSCALNCDPADVTCQASCLGIARPNSSQAVETNECANKCDQGDGSPAATEKFSQCVQACIASFFPSTQTAGVGAPAAPSGAASNAASATGSAGAAASSGASRAASGTGSSEPTGSSGASGSAASSSPTGAASLNQVQLTGAGLAGLAMAIFAL